MTHGVTPEPPVFLSSVPAQRGDRRLALAVVLVSLLIFLAAAPFARVKLPPVWAFIPIYESALAISDLITAVLLFYQFTILRSRALLMLACGYLFTAVMVVPHALTFPGLFSATGLIGAGAQSTAWLYMFWHAGLPVVVIYYALLKDRDGDRARSRESSHAAILSGVAVVLAVACALTLLATVGQALLPAIMRDNGYTPLMIGVVAAVWTLSIVALLALWMRQPHSVLDLWLMVVMCVWLFDVALSAVLNAGRFDLGFYAGRIYGLLAATFILLLLQFEAGALYARLAGLLTAEQQERRRETEERRRIFETSLDLILIVDRRGTFIRVSPSCAEILGYQPEELIGRNAREFLYPDDLADTREQMRAARRGQLVRNFDCRYVRKDGRVVTLAWTGVWSEPEQQHFFIGRDMTERRLAEDALKQSLARQEAIFKSAILGIITLNESGSIEALNPAAQRLFGYSDQTIDCRDIGRLIDLGGTAELGSPARLRHRAASGGVYELSAQRSDGSAFPIDFAIAEMPIGDRRMFVAFMRDITERKRNERLKDEFVATVSHELRTPLTSIAGSLALLCGDAAGKLPGPAIRLLTIAHTNSQRLVRLINDILDIEKIESGKVVFDMKRIEVRSLVEQAIEANRGFSVQHNVHVRLDPASAVCYAAADSDRLTQVVTNLLSNAVKFSPPDEEVAVAIEALEQAVRITVGDRGAGIPEDFKPRIFEKFAQADGSDARQKGGTGLGLSIVKQIVIRLGGEVGFIDAPGGGTIFHVELPRWEMFAGADGAREEDASAHVLVCEDYPIVAKVLADRLAKAGFRTDIALTGADATECAATHRYAAILVDLQLPDCDGISLIQQLRAQPNHGDTPIVVVSADPNRGRDDVRSSDLNILDWFQKPVDIARLAQVLDRPRVRNVSARPHILHVDDDPNVLSIVAQALEITADVVSVDSIEGARRALAAHHFDLAVLDVALAAHSGLELLPELRDSNGDAIPVIVFSAQGANPMCAARVHAALIKNSASIDKLIATLRKRFMDDGSHASKEKEMA